MTPPVIPDRSALAGRIQGYGNFNPPPQEEETAKSVTKKVVTNVGSMLGEEVALTVQDFREKGAVGAVKDAVADAGDLLIDGVSGIFGWIRGDAPQEEESQESKQAADVLATGPSGAAYGVSQASPTGGINAVWVMPEDADAATMAELASQVTPSANVYNQQAGVPAGIQPYCPAPSYNGPAGQMPFQATPGAPISIPGGPTIAPYQPPPSTKGGFSQAGAFQAGKNFSQAGAFNPAGGLGGYGGGAPGFAPAGFSPSPGGFQAGGASAAGASNSTSATKALVDRIAKGEVIAGSDVAKRLTSQATATKTSSKQLGDMISERARRLYLGLDGGNPEKSDESLANILALTDSLMQQDSKLAKDAAMVIKGSISEELLSLRSSAKYRAKAEPALKRLGLVESGPPPVEDLLGDASPAGPAVSTDLLGGPSPVQSVDLLG